MNFRKFSVISHLGISLFLYLLYTIHILYTILAFSLAVANVITSDVLGNFSSAELDFSWCYSVNHWSLPSDQESEILLFFTEINGRPIDFSFF